MAKKKTDNEIVIKAPNVGYLTLRIRGRVPYVQNRFSARAIEGIVEDQEKGGVKTKKKKPPRDFDAEYQEALHISTEGWYGIPATGLKDAIVRAAKLAGHTMTDIKVSVFVEEDGYDRDGITPLVRIAKGEPHPTMAMVRNQAGVYMPRVRPAWQPGWEAIVTIRYNADVLSADEVANLLAHAGEFVGIGEGRPSSKNSSGMGWGLFKIVTDDDESAEEAQDEK